MTLTLAQADKGSGGVYTWTDDLAGWNSPAWNRNETIDVYLGPDSTSEPQVTAINDQRLIYDSTNPENLVLDVDATDDGTLQYYAHSSNPAAATVTPTKPDAATDPPALEANSKVTITPVAAGVTTITVIVTDGTNPVAETFQVSVEADEQPTLTGGPGDQEWNIESAITPATLPEATGGNAPLTYALTPALPAGLSFNDETRVISGTPTAIHLHRD